MELTVCEPTANVVMKSGRDPLWEHLDPTMIGVSYGLQVQCKIHHSDYSGHRAAGDPRFTVSMDVSMVFSHAYDFEITRIFLVNNEMYL